MEIDGWNSKSLVFVVMMCYIGYESFFVDGKKIYKK